MKKMRFSLPWFPPRAATTIAPDESPSAPSKEPVTPAPITPVPVGSKGSNGITLQEASLTRQAPYQFMTIERLVAQWEREEAPHG